jgi:DDE superfamily endonuclease
LVRRAGRPRLRRKKGAIERLSIQPPEGAAVVCLDEMGPTVPKTFAGMRVIRDDPGVEPDGTSRPAGRAKREVETGKRQRGGYVFGAFRPATGEAFTHCYEKRNGVNWVDFLERVEGWIPPEVVRVYAVLDNLPTHRTTDVLLFALWHPRWEFVSSPGTRLT